jgi:hypothetical protein
MISIRQILNKVVPKLRALEENPEVTIIRPSTPASTNPFATQTTGVYDTRFVVPVVYSEQPEISTSANNISTQQVLYLYIQTSVISFEITYLERFIFKNKRYKPTEIQELFGLWKVKVTKE